MKIVCPSCEATYEVPDKVVQSRRKMRCARCATDWVPADQHTPADLAVPEEAPHPAAEPPAHERIVEPVAAHVPEAAPAFTVAPPEETVTADDDLADPPGEVAAEALPARREEEPYQLALRPETHISVFQEEPRAIPASFPKVTPAPSNVPVVLAWGVSVLVLAGALAAFVMFRTPVMKAWPPSVRLYAALGLAGS